MSQQTEIHANAHTTTGSALADHIRELAICNRQLKLFNERVKPIRQKKQAICKVLGEYMDTHGIKTRTLEINGEPMKLVQRQDYAPLTMGFVRNCLEDIMEDAEQIDTVMDYLREQRGTKMTVDLRGYTVRGGGSKRMDGYESEGGD